MRKLSKKATETATESTAAKSATPAAPARVPDARGCYAHEPDTGKLAFTADRKELHAALKRLANVADRKSTMPMLANVAIRASADGVVLAATDLNIYAIVTAPAWKVHSTGGYTVNAKSLADLLAKLPNGDITIGVTSLGMEVKSGTIRVSLRGLPDRDFPKIPALLPSDPADKQPHTAVDAGAFKGLLQSVSPAICKDQTRFHLAGVSFEYDGTKAVAVATDGHRLMLAQREMPRAGDYATPAKGVILPEKSVKEICRLLKAGTCELGALGPFFVVRQGGTTLACKTIDAQFPPYWQVVPKDNARLVTVDRIALIGAIERAALMASETRGVAFEVEGQTLTIAADHPDNGQTRETLPAECRPDAPAFTVGFNARYMLDALKSVTCDSVTVALSKNALDPILVRDTSHATQYAITESPLLVVVMPMRI